MYKCSNCGEVFEEPKPIKEDWGEAFSVCPYCNGDYDEVKQCDHCDEWHTEEELYDGWCEKCLRETISYDTFFEYCEANKDENYLDTFVMTEFFDVEMPKYSSYDFHLLMIRVYNERVEGIKTDKNLFGKSHDEFLDACIRFIMEDDGECGRENYADWLNKREVKK